MINLSMERREDNVGERKEIVGRDKDLSEVKKGDLVGK